MKGFQQDTGPAALYFSVKHHGIVEESKREREGFTPIEVTVQRTGETVTKFIKRYKAIEGFVRKIEYRDSEFDGLKFQSWKIHLVDDEGKLGILDLLLNSNPGSRFMKLAENLDFTKPVEFSAWHDTKDDKTAFIVRQDEQSVPQKYTRENPGDCPEPTQRGRQGKWDYTEQEDFLYDRMINVVIPAVDAAEATRSIGQPKPDSPADGEDWSKATMRVINIGERARLVDAVQVANMPPAVATEIIGRFGFTKSTDITVDMLAEVMAAISDWRPAPLIDESDIPF